MGRIANLSIIFIFVFLTMFVTLPFAAKLLGNERHKDDISHLTGSVDTSLIRSGFIHVSFDGKLINGCGDTEILGFITGPNGLPLQLKPIFLPKSKAEEISEMTGSGLLWPVFDVLPLLSDGQYKLELYVKKDCGWDNTAVKLKTMTFEIGESV